MIENKLQSIVQAYPEGELKESVAYSLLQGGKRIRPVLAIETTKLLNGNLDWALDAGCALEMIHTYSLIHDDLPALDNDTYRRHKLCNHLVHGEDIAILAGDTLLSDAFKVISNIDIDPILHTHLYKVFSQNIGINGMILGQQYDIKAKETSIEELNQTYILKTGKLFAVAFSIGVICSNRIDLLTQAQKLGELLGLYFQYQDDILDVNSDLDSLGKDIQSDLERGKPTIYSFLDDNEIQITLDNLKKEIVELLNTANLLPLNSIIEEIFIRKK